MPPPKPNSAPSNPSNPTDEDMEALRKEVQMAKELGMAERQARVMTRAKEQEVKDTKHDEFLGEQLKCAICWEMMVQPRLLACGHYFCSDCILKERKTRLGLLRVLPDGSIQYLPERRPFDDLERIVKCPQCQRAIIFRPSRAYHVAFLVASLCEYKGWEKAEPALPFDWPFPHPELLELAKEKYKDS
ncbi:hypothetical protein AAF712_010899 [Marasmius tenuissimus]|uniref:RING-type domain-containing protein n=1 Tax=Marasmius tenuissimus TaxID=585030 RepID=A0ABR2ZPA4_9AGAR